jgi:hypothetical protein
MTWLQRLVSKRLWFLMFNVICILYFVVTDSLRFSFESILTAGFALMIMNAIALISARKFPDWK